MTTLTTALHILIIIFTRTVSKILLVAISADSEILFKPSFAESHCQGILPIHVINDSRAVNPVVA